MTTFPFPFSPRCQVIMIDLVLAGDNAVVIGLAAAGLPNATARARHSGRHYRGDRAAHPLRRIAVELLAIIGLLLAGGILLLWVCWKMWRELRGRTSMRPRGAIAGGTCQPPRKTFAQAAWQIVVADISMSLDNVLAVAGAAREHPTALVFGLGLSIVLMGVAASFIARLLNQHRWIAYVGLAIILYVRWRHDLARWPRSMAACITARAFS